MTGTCKPGKEVQKSSDPLALEQFLSAFLLLMCGILLATVLLLLEHLYFKYVRHHLAKSDRGGCCALVSLVSKAQLPLSVMWFFYATYNPNETTSEIPVPHKNNFRLFVIKSNYGMTRYNVCVEFIICSGARCSHLYASTVNEIRFVQGWGKIMFGRADLNSERCAYHYQYVYTSTNHPDSTKLSARCPKHDRFS